MRLRRKPTENGEPSRVVTERSPLFLLSSFGPQSLVPLTLPCLPCLTTSAGRAWSAVRDS
ncbi:hypothetical protein [uncultured Marinococcus sp.]|uniref:hypothetical protein n=1 Tax=uncultured Marinococcus sp. TaxID=487012 RepID=UPI002610BA3E|nr:hypothetical protein [uncultured Marinococcus sp.]